jgi:site-specific DNA-methyltransferase (adenine-specific)
LKDGGSIAVFSRWDVQEYFIMAIKCAGLAIKNVLIWDRQIHGMGDLKGNFAPQHDVILFATKGKFKIYGNRPKSVLRSKRLQGVNLVHPNEKPVDLLEQLINSLTKENETVLDCFMGSGSTGVACVNTGRKFIGIEKDEKYFEIAKNRIMEHASTSS